MPGYFEPLPDGGAAVALDTVEISIIRSLAVQLLELIGPGPAEDGDADPLAELFAEGDSEASDDLKGSLDDEPVILSSLLGRDLEILKVVVVGLARVLLLKDEAEVGGNLLERSRASGTAGRQDGRSAKLKSGGNVAVDLGDNTPTWLLACVPYDNVFVEQWMQVA